MKKNIISVLIVLLVVIALPSCKKLEESYTSGTEQMTADQLFDQGKYEEAIKEYQKAIDTDADGVLHLKLARAYEKIGKIELALENYKIAKEISDFLTNDANNKIEELEKIKEIQNEKQIENVEKTANTDQENLEPIENKEDIAEETIPTENNTKPMR